MTATARQFQHIMASLCGPGQSVPMRNIVHEIAARNHDPAKVADLVCEAISRTERPKHRVWLATPVSDGWVHAAHKVACMAATQGRCALTPSVVSQSLLAYGFNQAWAAAIAAAAQGRVDFFCMVHADIQPLRIVPGPEGQILTDSAGWLDHLIDECLSLEADMVSCVAAIKNRTGLTSTAVDDGDPWNPRKLTLAEIEALPQSFSTADLPAPLLVNTGCWVADLRRPWAHEVDAEGNLRHYFTIRDRVRYDREHNTLVTEVQPEDWGFSRMMHESGARYFATKRVRTVHHGAEAYPSWLSNVFEQPTDSGAESEAAAPERAMA